MISEGRRADTPAPRKRRRANKVESIYLKSEATPYTPAIKPLRVRGASAGRIPAPNGEGDENDAESSEMAARRAEKSERMRLGALKAWETKRRKQRARFEALESGFVTPQDIDMTDTMDPFLSHLFVPNDTPKDDLLEAIHEYASSRYHAHGLILPPNPSRTRVARPIDKKPTLQSAPVASVDTDEDDGEPSGSEYQASDNGQEEARDSTSTMGDQTAQVKRKRGGQRGRRKVKDLHLAMDGTALLALGTLIQELIVASVKQEGFVKAGTLRDDRGGTFQLSDSEGEDEDP